MRRSTSEERRQQEGWSREELAGHQLARWNRLLTTILPENGFYAQRLSDLTTPLKSLDEVARFPFTFKNDLLGESSEEPYAVNLTYPLERYVRFHRTSGTRGRPLVILDTAEDWQWWIECWQYVLDAAEVEADDRVLLAFSFGPFIGFWSAFDAVVDRGALVIPGGGIGTAARLELLQTQRATCLLCTPSYALHMAEVAFEQGIDPARLNVRRIIVAGEPGGSIPATKTRIETAWDARVVDHSGATEVGAWGYADREGTGLFVNEAEFFAEFLSVETGQAAAEGELSELVISSLGRFGSPLIRYRTGDLVRPTWCRQGENRFVFLTGGVLGRADDMMIIRGVNVFPSSIEQILRSFPEILEYRMTAFRSGEMDQLKVEVEDRREEPTRIAKELHLRLGLRIDVQAVPVGSLPRFEAKGKRFVDRR